MDPLLKVKRLKQVDYSELRRQAEELKNVGSQSFSKYKKLAAVSKTSRDQEMMKQHQTVWHKELSRINVLRKGFQRDLDELSLRALTESQLRHAFLEFESLENSLSKDREAFKEAVIAPVFMLSEDLKFYAQRKTSGAAVPEPEPVQDVVADMKAKLGQVGEGLLYEEAALRQDLNCEGLLEFMPAQEVRMTQTGIPDEAWETECPDEDLKVALLQEFLLLDQTFQERLDVLSLRDQTQPPPPKLGPDWSIVEREQLDAISDEYEHSCLTAKHTLKMDMFVRTCPGRSRQDLFNFDMWWSSQRALTNLRRALISDWFRARRELLARLKVEFAETQELWERAAERQEAAQRQHELCEQLCSRVSEWRERRLEADRLAAELRAEEDQLRAEAEEEERAREEKRREKEKEQIKEFRARRQEAEAREAARREERLQELRAYLEQQAEHDRQRVEYREQLLEQRQVEVAKREEQQRVMASEAEARLERLRLQVRPQHIEADPLRLHGATEAWQKHVQSEEKNPEAPLQQALFSTNTYSDRQLMSDPRLKVEVALRNAGLAETSYARTVMSKLQPLQPPRKDMQSTVRFGDS